MRPITVKKVRVIGGCCKVVAETRIEILFHTLGITIDVNFYIMNSDH